MLPGHLYYLMIFFFGKSYLILRENNKFRITHCWNTHKQLQGTRKAPTATLGFAPCTCGPWRLLFHFLRLSILSCKWQVFKVVLFQNTCLASVCGDTAVLNGLEKGHTDLSMIALSQDLSRKVSHTGWLQTEHTDSLTVFQARSLRARTC